MIQKKIDDHLIQTFARSLRVRHHLSLQGLANKLYISKTALSKFENHHDKLNSDKLEDLFILYHIDYNEMVIDYEKMKEQFIDYYDSLFFNDRKKEKIFLSNFNFENRESVETMASLFEYLTRYISMIRFDRKNLYIDRLEEILDPYYDNGESFEAMVYQQYKALKLFYNLKLSESMALFQSIRNGNRENEKVDIMNCYFIINLAYKLGNMALAYRNCRLAEEGFKKFHNMFRLAQTLMLHAKLQADIELYDEAIKTNLEALYIFEALSQKSKNIDRIRHNISLYYMISNRYLESLNMSKIIDADFLVDSDAAQISYCYYQLGNRDEALLWIERGKKLPRLSSSSIYFFDYIERLLKNSESYHEMILCLEKVVELDLVEKQYISAKFAAKLLEELYVKVEDYKKAYELKVKIEGIKIVKNHELK